MSVRKKLASELVEQLKKETIALFESQRYREYLDMLSKFYSYSARNCLLIMLQNPDATKVAGLKKWEKEFERRVKPGEKGIRILAPMRIKKEVKPDGADHERNTEKTEKEVVGFKVAYVFDVSQTTGKALPAIYKPLEGMVPEFERLKTAVEMASPYKIVYRNIDGGAEGLCSYKQKKIYIQTGMSEENTLRVLVHEVAHASLHNPELDTEHKIDRKTREVQAESVAYVTCKRLGIDAEESSVGYVAGWSSGKDVKELTASMEVIKRQSDLIYEKICEELGIELNKGMTEPMKLTAEDFKVVM